MPQPPILLENAGSQAAAVQNAVTPFVRAATHAPLGANVSRILADLLRGWHKPENHYSGTTDFKAGIETACAAVDDYGGAVYLDERSLYPISTHIRGRHGMRLVGPGGISSPTSDAFEMGSFLDSVPGLLTWSPINAITLGSTTVTTTTASHAGRISPSVSKGGGYVLIRSTGAGYTTAGALVAGWGSLNRATSVNASTGVIELAYPVSDEAVAAAEIAYIDPAVMTGWDSGTVPAYVLEDVHIDIGDVVCADIGGTLFRGGAGGVLGGLIKMRTFRGDSWVFGNLCRNVRFEAQRVEASRHLAECAMYSENVDVYAQTYVITGAGESGKLPIRGSGNCRGIRIGGQSLQAKTYAEFSLIYLAECRRMTIDFDHIIAPSLTGYLLSVKNTDWVGANAANFQQRTEDMVLRVGLGEVGSCTSFFNANNDGGGLRRITLRDSRFNGTAVSAGAVNLEGEDVQVIRSRWNVGAPTYATSAVNPRIIDCYGNTAMSPPSTVGRLGWTYRTPHYALAKAQQIILQVDNDDPDAIQTTTAESVLPNSAQTFPINSLQLGDILEFEAAIEVAGTNNTKRFKLMLNSTVAVSLTFAAADVGNCVVRGSMKVRTVTAGDYFFQITTPLSIGSTINSAGVTLANITSATNSTEARAWVTNATDSIKIRRYSARIRKNGE